MGLYVFVRDLSREFEMRGLGRGGILRLVCSYLIRMTGSWIFFWETMWALGRGWVGGWGTGFRRMWSVPRGWNFGDNGGNGWVLKCARLLELLSWFV